MKYYLVIVFVIEFRKSALDLIDFLSKFSDPTYKF